MPHFVIKSNGIDGENFFALEYHHSCVNLNGRTYDHECYELPDWTQHPYTLDDLIKMYKSGVRPKKPTMAKPTAAIPAPDKPATPQPRNEMG